MNAQTIQDSLKLELLRAEEYMKTQGPHFVVGFLSEAIKCAIRDLDYIPGGPKSRRAA